MNPYQSPSESADRPRPETRVARSRRALWFGLKCAAATALVLAGLGVGFFGFSSEPIPAEDLQPRIRSFSRGATRLTMVVFVVAAFGSWAAEGLRRGNSAKA